MSSKFNSFNLFDFTFISTFAELLFVSQQRVSFVQFGVELLLEETEVGLLVLLVHFGNDLILVWHIQLWNNG